MIADGDARSCRHQSSEVSRIWFNERRERHHHSLQAATRNSSIDCSTVAGSSRGWARVEMISAKSSPVLLKSAHVQQSVQTDRVAPHAYVDIPAKGLTQVQELAPYYSL